MGVGAYQEILKLKRKPSKMEWFDASSYNLKTHLSMVMSASIFVVHYFGGDYLQIFIISEWIL